jgi:hypothetical protein
MKHDVKGAACTGAGAPTHDIGLTALALLAFLDDGSTTRTGPHREVVGQAVRWLVDQQQPNGRLGAAATTGYIYDHAIATWALCEAYGHSGNEDLRAPAQRAVEYLDAHRNPYMVWRYQPRDNDNDTSVTAWCVLAHRSASAFKLKVNESVAKLAATWFDLVTDPKTGHAGYTRRGEPSSRMVGEIARFPPHKNEALTAATLVCRFLLGQDPKTTPIMTTSADLILSKPPVWDEEDGSLDLYAWFHASHAFSHMDGHHWKEWQGALFEALVAKQRTDGNFGGSWDPDHDVWGKSMGRVYMTALGVLTLESFYRFAKVVRH